MTFYHTQENRSKKLQEPIICTNDNAWLGEASYFWEEENDAVFWGNTHKRKTGNYDIYSSDIIIDEDILDTVFNRLHYKWWIKQVEKVAKKFIKSTNSNPTLKEINDYFLEKGVWTKFDGILFQDISKNPVHFMVKEFQYKKRIQLALYNREKILNFALHYTGECV